MNNTRLIQALIILVPIGVFCLVFFGVLASAPERSVTKALEENNIDYYALSIDNTTYLPITKDYTINPDGSIECDVYISTTETVRRVYKDWDGICK